MLCANFASEESTPRHSKCERRLLPSSTLWRRHRTLASRTVMTTELGRTPLGAIQLTSQTV